MKAEVVVAGLQVPEGPTVLPDGRIAFTEQTAGRISVLDGSAAVALVRTGGAANSCVVGTDGLLYLCQNGGVVGDWRAARPAVPAIQRATPGPVDQPVETLAVEVAGLPRQPRSAERAAVDRAERLYRCRCRRQSAGTAPAGPGAGWSAGRLVAGASSGPSPARSLA